MKQFVFNYSAKFSCINSKCQHNCCKGWEINIDKRTKEKYLELTKKDSRFNEKAFNGNSFNLTEDLTCPFLDKDNLCHIIKNYGEKYLCKTCKTHPRFKNFFSGVVETGLGLYCEEACRIILTSKSKMRPVLIKDDNKPSLLNKFEKKVLKTRKKILNVLQNRKLSINERLKNLINFSDINLEKLSFSEWKKVFCSLEKLKINEFSFENLKNSDSFYPINEDFSLYFEQILCYFTFRHISPAFDLLDLRVRTAFIILLFKMINQIFMEKDGLSLENLIESCRFLASEIEVNLDNQNAILNQIELLVSYK